MVEREYVFYQFVAARHIVLPKIALLWLENQHYHRYFTRYPLQLHSKQEDAEAEQGEKIYTRKKVCYTVTGQQY
jgi:hypothetical protein